VRRLLAPLVAAAAIVALVAPPSSAIDHGSVGLMTPTKTHLAKEFPPLAGVYPLSAGPQVYGLFNTFACANVSYCNRHVLEVDVPDGYLESFKGGDIVSYGVKVTLTWADPELNDLDLFVGWANETESSGPPQGPCSTPIDAECDNLKQETFSVVEPKPEDDPATAADESKIPAPVYISVVNHTGVNTGYELAFQWFLIPFGSFEAFEPPTDREVSRVVTEAQTPKPLDDGSPKDAPDPSTKILIPGKDGKLVEQTLGFLASGLRSRSEKTGTAPWVWIVSAAVSALAVAGFGILVWRRRRDEGIARAL
jgi:hypothetical protein